MPLKETPSHLLPKSTGVSISKLKKISLSDDDDSDDVSSVESQDHRLPAPLTAKTSAAEAPLNSLGSLKEQPARAAAGKPSRSLSSSSSSLTLSLSDDDGARKKKETVAVGASSDATRREGTPTAHNEEPVGASRQAPPPPSSSSSSSSSLDSTPSARPIRLTAPSAAAKPGRPPPSLTTARPVTSTAPSPASAAAAPASAKSHTALPSSSSGTAVVPPPSLSGRAPRVTELSPSLPVPAGPPAPPVSTEPKPAIAIHAFKPDTPAAPLTTEQPPAAPAPDTRPAEPAKQAPDRRRTQQYNRICTDPSAQTSALPRAALRLPTASQPSATSTAAATNMKEGEERHGSAAAVPTMRRDDHHHHRRRGADPADVLAAAASAGGPRDSFPTRKAPSLSAGATPTTATASASPSAASPTSVSTSSPTGPSGSGALDPANRVAVPTGRLRALHRSHRHGHHDALEPSRPTNEEPVTHGDTSSVAALSLSPLDEEAEAATDSTYAPCAAHQRRSAAKAAFDKQLEAQLVVTDDAAWPRAAGQRLHEGSSGMAAAGFGRDVCRSHGAARGTSLGDWLLLGTNGPTAPAVDEPAAFHFSGAEVTAVSDAWENGTARGHNRLPAPQPVVRGWAM